MQTTTRFGRGTDDVGTLCEGQPLAVFEERMYSVSVLRHIWGDQYEGIVHEGGRAVNFAARLPGFDIEADGYVKTGDIACRDVRVPGIAGTDRALLVARIYQHFNEQQEVARAKNTS